MFFQLKKEQSYKRISTAIKIDILKKIDKNIGISKIAKSVQLPKSTVFSIKKDREKLNKFFLKSLLKVLKNCEK